MSNLRPEARQNSGDNVFEGIPVGEDEASLFAQFLDAHDCRRTPAEPSPRTCGSSPGGSRRPTRNRSR